MGIENTKGRFLDVRIARAILTKQSLKPGRWATGACAGEPYGLAVEDGELIKYETAPDRAPWIDYNPCSRRARRVRELVAYLEKVAGVLDVLDMLETQPESTLEEVERQIWRRTVASERSRGA